MKTYNLLTETEIEDCLDEIRHYPSLVRVKITDNDLMWMVRELVAKLKVNLREEPFWSLAMIRVDEDWLSDHEAIRDKQFTLFKYAAKLLNEKCRVDIAVARIHTNSTTINYIYKGRESVRQATAYQAGEVGHVYVNEFIYKSIIRDMPSIEEWTMLNYGERAELLKTAGFI